LFPVTVSALFNVQFAKKEHKIPQTTVCPEKKDQNDFFCNIFYKTRAILEKLGTPFPE